MMTQTQKAFQLQMQLTWEAMVSEELRSLCSCTAEHGPTKVCPCHTTDAPVEQDEKLHCFSFAKHRCWVSLYLDS